MADITIAYLTFRKNPRFEWFAKSLAREFRACGLDAARAQVVVIDGRLWHEETTRRGTFAAAAAGYIDFEHHAPKPSVWQGPHRLTTKDYFCAASARNPAFAYARGKHVAFVDDLSVLLPGWLESHLKAAEWGHALCGTTCKNKNIDVDDAGNVTGYVVFPPGQDSRMKNIVAPWHKCTGSWLFGGTFSVPLETALKVNGQDEINDTIGGEDYDFGIRIERSGTPIFITKRCGTFEDEDGHHAEAPMIRLDKPWPGADGPYSSNYLLNTLLRDERRFTTRGNGFVLRELRERVLAGEPFPVPTEPKNHWVDWQPLGEM